MGETLELVRAYCKIRESRMRMRIFEMVKAVGAASHAEVLSNGNRRKPGAPPPDQSAGMPLVCGLQQSRASLVRLWDRHET